MSCSHCEQAISTELAKVAGVAAVDVDLDAKSVRVRGEGMDDAAVVAAIAEAGYEATVSASVATAQRPARLAAWRTGHNSLIAELPLPDLSPASREAAGYDALLACG